MAQDSSQTVEILIKLRDEISRGLKKTNTQLKLTEKFAKVASRAMGVLRASLATISRVVFSLQGAIGALGIGLLARSFTKAASTAEQYQIRLNALLGSVKQGNALFKEMSTFAGTVSFQYEEIMGSATALAGVMKGGNKEIGEWMPLIADLASVSGLGIQDTTSQIIRMYSAGAAAADLFRERGILAMLGFKAGVSVSAEKTRAQLMKAWKDPESQFKEASKKLASTWQGMLSMMSDGWFQFRTMVMDSGVFNYMKGALSLILDKFAELRESGDLEKWAETLSKYIIEAMRGIAHAAGVVIDVWNGWKMVWASLTIGFAYFARGVNTGLNFMMTLLHAYLNNLQQSISAITTIAQRMSRFDVTGLSGKLAENLKEAGGTLKDLSTYTKDFGENTETSAAYWDDVLQDAQKVVVELAKQDSSLVVINKLLGQIESKANAYAEAARKAAEAPDKEKKKKGKPEAKFEAQIKSSVARFLQESKTGLQQLQDFYDKGIIKFAGYFKTRSVMLEANFQKEMAAMRQLETLETDPTKKLKIQDQIFAKQQAHHQALFALQQERDKAEVAEGQKRVTLEEQMSAIKLRIARAGVQDGTAIHQMEMDALAQQHADELEQLRALGASKAEIEETYRKQQVELDKKAAETRMNILNGILSATRSSLSVLGDYYKQMYEDSDKTSKKHARRYKRTMIAIAIIDTMTSAIKAYLSLASVPYVGAVLGAVAAAAAVASGMARVNQIRNQQLAEGGMVKGRSPHSKADNLTIDATAGEFMHPVDTVRYYGRRGMEIIKNKLVPRETLYNMARGISVPLMPPAPMRHAYATGGSIGAGSSGGAGESRGGDERPITINNIYDPDLVGQHLGSTAGERQVMNVMSNNQFKLKQIVLGE